MHVLHIGPPAVAVKLPLPGNGAGKTPRPRKRPKTEAALMIAGILAGTRPPTGAIARAVGLSPRLLKAAIALDPFERHAALIGERSLVPARRISLSKQIAALADAYGVDVILTLLAEVAGASRPNGNGAHAPQAEMTA